MSFNSSKVFVRGHAINNVEGNQVNHSQTITAEVVHINSQREMERTEYDEAYEFEQVKRGQIYALKRLHTGDASEWWGWEWELKDGELGHQQTKYTVAFYEGEDAQFYWERDFEHFSRAGLGKPDAWQLYGLNRSKIPFLIFHDGLNQFVVELVPLAHFYKESLWGDLYVWMLTEQLHCHESRIWLNMEGNLCKGLKGPYIKVDSSTTSFDIIVPPSAQMLQDDIFVNFLQQSFSLQLEQDVLRYASLHLTRTYLDDLFPEPTNYHPSSDHVHSHWTFKSRLESLFRNLPYHLPLNVIDGLRFDTVYSTSRGAVARWPRGKRFWEANYGGLVNKTNMGDGLIRFKLDDPEYVRVSFKYPHDDFKKSWLAQSSRIIDAHGVSGMEEKCFIVNPPHFELFTPQFGHHRYPITLKDLPPIYLFIYPPPSPLSISELKSWEKGHTHTHFWSLDKNGQSEISEEECRRWGIAKLIPWIVWGCLMLFSWSTDVYTPLRKWQVARGFDPTTTDWAQSWGYPEWEIIGGKEEEARFEGVHDGVSYLIKLREQELDDILESSAFIRDPSLHSPESTPRASHLDEQGGLPEQNDSSSVQEYISYASKVREQDAELQLGTSMQIQEIATITKLPPATSTPKPAPEWNPRQKRKSESTAENSQAEHNEYSGERPKKRRKKRTLKKPITMPRRVK
ncbi:hypothetical protein VNI00_016527 [Paramarasmius palmivorus]|uniref:Uncharacterized protein n=1 Tax=Paramarasmius palmivorus TaxID=297713 RepID=A0AAW0BEN5_9AGAR